MYFKDIGKAASDFVKKDFPTSHKVEVNSRPKDVELKVSAEFRGESAKVVVEPKHTCKDWNLEVSGLIDSVDALKVSADLRDKLIEGLKTSLEFSSSRDVQRVVAGLDYKNTWGTAKADFEFPSNNKTAATVGVVLVKKEASLGVEARANLGAEPAVASVSAGLQYRKPDFTGAFFVRSAGDALSLEGSYVHALKCCQLVAGARYSVNDSKTCLAFGWAKKLEDGSTFKTLFASDGSVSASYKHTLSSCASFTAGTKINASTMASQVGVHLVLNL